MTHVFEKKNDLSKENYRAVSVFFRAFKLFEKIVFNKMNQKKTNRILQKPQHRKCLPKAFDTLNHNLSLAQLNGVGIFFQCNKICSKLFVAATLKGKYKYQFPWMLQTLNTTSATKDNSRSPSIQYLQRHFPFYTKSLYLQLCFC